MLAIVADDQAIVREAISRIIHDTYHFEVLQSVDANGAVQHCTTRTPSLVLLEILMPGLDSFSAAADIRRMCPSARIAILTRHKLLDQVVRARRLRLNGFILKQDSPEELSYAIRTIISGGFYAPPAFSEALRDLHENHDPLAALTQREKSVLALFAQGLSIKEIANELNVSTKTAETHRNNFGRKLGHPNRSQITAFALKHNLVGNEQLAVSL